MTISTKNIRKNRIGLSVRDQIIDEISNLIIVMDIHQLNGWEDIEFAQIDNLRNSMISTEELYVLRELLDNKYEEMLYQLYLEEYYLQ
ncbi:hypothetical protein [Bacillus tuaregi]|uniref:hypothetical protein n=1 Tax=Bacillus tuaregi TaxID=1816695 RepID=UPI0008F8E94A|nr:hypothetical protein [Bacillus tuaregi]